MNELISAQIATFLLTYWLHSSLFIGAVLLCRKTGVLGTDNKTEQLLKGALLIGFFSSALSMLPSDLFDSPKPPLIDVNLSATRNIDRANHAAVRPEIRSLQPEATGTSTKLTGLDLPPVIVAPPVKRLLPNVIEPVWPNPIWAGISALTWLSLLWFTGGILMLTTKAFRFRQLKSMLKDRASIDSSELQEQLSSIKKRAGLSRNITVTESKAISSPLVLSSHEIVLPTDFASSYNQKQVEAAMAHEMAHLVRHDIIWRRFMLFLEAVFFFQPLNKILNKELVDLAEINSDQLACKWTGDPRSLAEALSIAAAINLHIKQSQWVVTMKASGSPILIRVQNLLERSNIPNKKMGLWLASFICLVILIGAPRISVGKISQSETIPKLAATVQGVSDFGSISRHSVSEEVDDEGNIRFYLQIKGEHKSLNVKADLSRKIIFDEALGEVDYFPPNSSMEVKTKTSKDSRKLKISSDDGDIQYLYYEQGKKSNFDSQAKAWFAGVIPAILRNSGWQASERIARIAAESGYESVLDEISQIRSDGIASLYFKHLMTLGKLSDEQLQRAILLTEILESDSAHASTLEHILNTQSLSVSHFKDLLYIGLNIESDSQQSRMLGKAIRVMPDDNSLYPSMSKALASIQSDSQLARLLEDLIQTTDLSSGILKPLFVSANGIESDSELSNLLIQVAEQATSRSLMKNTLALSRTIESDSEMRRLMIQLISMPINNGEVAKLIDTSAKHISSDSELARLLVKVADKRGLSGKIEQAIRNALTEISSDSERRRVMQTIPALG